MKAERNTCEHISRNIQIRVGDKTVNKESGFPVHGVSSKKGTI